MKRRNLRQKSQSTERKSQEASHQQTTKNKSRSRDKSVKQLKSQPKEQQSHHNTRKSESRHPKQSVEVSRKDKSKSKEKHSQLRSQSHNKSKKPEKTKSNENNKNRESLPKKVVKKDNKSDVTNKKERQDSATRETRSNSRTRNTNNTIQLFVRKTKKTDEKSIKKAKVQEELDSELEENEEVVEEKVQEKKKKNVKFVQDTKSNKQQQQKKSEKMVNEEEESNQEDVEDENENEKKDKEMEDEEELIKKQQQQQQLTKNKKKQVSEQQQQQWLPQQNQKQQQIQKESIQKKPKKAVQKEGDKQEESMLDIIKRYIQNTKDQPQSSVENRQKCYTLREDLIIISEIANDDQDGLGPKFWQTKIIDPKLIENRTIDSLRDRYKRYLKYLSHEDFEMIIDYLKETDYMGAGFMYFKKTQEGKKLEKISELDPQSNNVNQQRQIKLQQQQTTSATQTRKQQPPQQQKQQPPQKQQQIQDKKMPRQKSTSALSSDGPSRMSNSMQNQQQQLRTTKQQQQQQQQGGVNLMKRSALEIENNNINQFERQPQKQVKKSKCICSIKPVKPVIANNKMTIAEAIDDLIDHRQDMNLQKTIKQGEQSSLKIQTAFDKKRTVYRETSGEVNDLNSMLELFENMFHISKDEIIDELQACSGDIKDLMEFLEKNNQSVKWFPEDDRILRECQSVADSSFKLLIRYKGEGRIRQRIKFLKLDLPFNF